MAKLHFGFAALGFQGYSDEHTELVINALKKQPTPILAILWSSFGRGKKNLRQWYSATNGKGILQVYLSNEVDRRKTRKDIFNLAYDLDPAQFNRRLEGNDKQLIRAITIRTKKLLNFHNKFGRGQKLRIVCGLEHQMSQKAAQRYIEHVRDVVENQAEIGINPVGPGGSHFKGIGQADFLEIHEVTKKQNPGNIRYIAATDGYDICHEARDGKRLVDQIISQNHLAQVIQKFSNCEYFLLWDPMFNSLNGDSGASLPPSERKSAIEKRCIDFLVKFMKKHGKKQEISTYFIPKRVKLRNASQDRGFVFKKSDHGGTVWVVPFNYPKFDSVFLIEANGKRHKMEFSGYANNNRQHYRLAADPSTFPLFCTLLAIKKNTGWVDSFMEMIRGKKKWAWKLPNPSNDIRGPA